MKKLVYYIGVTATLLFAGLFLSCNQLRNINPQEPLVGKDTIPSPYFLTGITLPEQLLLQVSSVRMHGHADKYSELPEINLLVAGTHAGYYTDSERTLFLEYVRGIESGNYNKPAPAPNGNETLLGTISFIEVTALTNYDTKHPAGTSLRDLCVLTYESFAPFITSGYTSEQDSAYDGKGFDTRHGSTAYLHRPLNGEWIITLPNISTAIPNWRPADYIGNLLGFLEFTQAPDEPKQKIRVTLTLENGEKLRADTEIDFTVNP